MRNRDLAILERGLTNGFDRLDTKGLDDRLELHEIIPSWKRGCRRRLGRSKLHNRLIVDPMLP